VGAALERWEQRPERLAVSDNNPQGTPDIPPPPAAPEYPTGYATPTQDSSYQQPGAYPPPSQDAPPAYAPPAYGQQPPAYGQQQPAYGQQQPYGYGQQAPAPYGAYAYPTGQKTNGLAITSLISSIAAFVILPFIASIVGVITGHMALKQLRTSGENGRGLALAGVIVGWVGVAFGLIAILFIVIAIIAAINGTSATYNSYS